MRKPASSAPLVSMNTKTLLALTLPLLAAAGLWTTARAETATKPEAPSWTTTDVQAAIEPLGLEFACATVPPTLVLDPPSACAVDLMELRDDPTEPNCPVGYIPDLEVWSDCLFDYLVGHQADAEAACLLLANALSKYNAEVAACPSGPNQCKAAALLRYNNLKAAIHEAFSLSETERGEDLQDCLDENTHCVENI